jgi:two-component system chemotaxis response regulator CheB
VSRPSQIRVLVVDDSVVARRFITNRLERDQELDVIGTANSGRAALELVEQDPPDVLVLDEEMPEMSGRDVLRVLRKRHPEVAVIMFSARVGQGTMARFEALILGADDAVAKPRSSGGPVTDAHPTWTELLAKVKRAARSHERGGVHMDIAKGETAQRATPEAVARRRSEGAPAPVVASAPAPPAPSAPAVRPAAPPVPDRATPPVPERAAPPAARARRRPAPAVAPTPQPQPRTQRGARPHAGSPAATGGGAAPVGAAPARRTGAGRSIVTSDPGCVIIASSTGGPDALGVLFAALPADFPLPILVVQHMPADFTKLLAKRLDGRSALRVFESQGGEPVERGTAQIAPGEYHLEVVGRSLGSTTRLTTAAPENSCRPAADVMFRSAVAAYGDRLIAVVLSGMGQDGMLGCEHVRAAGGQVVAQDEDSSVVWGMPGAVVRAGLADVVLPIERIADDVTQRARALVGLTRGSNRRAMR